jgi:hypothetical protein
LYYEIKEAKGRSAYEVLDWKTKRHRIHVHGRPRCKEKRIILYLS